MIDLKLTIKLDGTRALELINGTVQELEAFAASAPSGRGRASVAVVRELDDVPPADDGGEEGAP